MVTTIRIFFSRQHALPLLIGVGLILIRFAPMFFGKTVLFGDNFSLMVPGKLFTAQWLSQGILPLWNPLLFAGIPWIGDINQSILYPTTLFFLLPSPGWALNLTLVFHQIFTLIGAYLLCWRWTRKKWLALIGALIWTFSPQMAGSFNNISTIQSLAWVPWVSLAGLGVSRRRWFVALFPIVVTFQLLAGYPQHVLYAVLMAVLLNAWVARKNFKQPEKLLRWLGTWVVTGLITILLSSFLWMPFIPVIQQSTRSIQTFKQAGSGSLHLEDTVKIIFPYIFDQPSEGMKWGPSWSRTPNVFLYISWFGVGVLAASFWRKQLKHADWFLLVVVVICIVYAFGSYLPGFEFIQQLPLIRQSRGISIILMIPALLLPILVSRAVNANQNWIVTWSRFRLVVIGLGVVTAGSIVGWLVVTQYFAQIWSSANLALHGALAASSFHTLERDEVITRLFFQNLTIVSLATMAVLFFLRKKRFAFVTMVIGLELIYFSSAHFRFGPVGVYTLDAKTDATQLLQTADLRSFRVLTRNYNAPYSDFGYYNDAMTVRAPFSDSFVDDSELEKFAVLQQMRDGFTPDWNMAAGVPLIHGYTTLLPLSLHDVFWDQTDDPRINNLSQIKTAHPGLRLWATKYYLVDTWFPDYGEEFPKQMLGETKNWRLYEIPNTLARFRDENDRPVELQEFSEQPNEIRFSTTNGGNQQFIIVADRYDADWHVSVNDQEVPLENYQGMRRFAVPEGSIDVKMWFYPKLFYQGVLISSVTLLALLGYCTSKLLHSRRSSS